MNITRTVVLLSIVSFFGDIASELLYPIMPLYLKSIGMGALYIGFLEGVADSVAGISKSYFGKMSDVQGRRMPFVWFGYSLSILSKSAIGLFANPFWILMTRSGDRLGKGVRTAARDTILSNEATPHTKGAVFGFHRAFDTLGAFLGPILGLIYLHYHPAEYRKLFLYALIPGFFVILALSFVKEHRTDPKNEKGNLFFSSLSYWKIATPHYKKILLLVLSFTLMNSSDMFLLLKARESGLSDIQVISLYIFYNLIYALSSYPMGILADRIGKKNVFLMGLCFFIITYAGMALNSRLDIFYLLFIFYGLFAAMTEGISKAWVSNLCEKIDLATALGFQATTQSLAAMLASFMAGIIWMIWGSAAMFLFSAIGTTVIAIMFLRERIIEYK